MNTRIKKLTLMLQDNAANARAIEDKLQKEYNGIFDADKKLAKALVDLENSTEYQGTDTAYGDIESWSRWDDLKDYRECRQYLDTWLMEAHCVRVDWQNDCLLMSQGDDNYHIQDDARRGDNGVWQGHKMIIDQSEYTSDDGEIDIAKRNALIEQRMELAGYFPGVFRVDQYGNVTAVNTNNEGDEK